MGSAAINSRAFFDQRLMDFNKSNPLTRTQALGYTFDESIQTLRSFGKAVLDCFDTKIFTSNDYQDIVARSWEQVGHRMSVTFCLAMSILFPQTGSDYLSDYLSENKSAFTEDNSVEKMLAKNNSSLRRENAAKEAENTRLKEEMARKESAESTVVDESQELPVAQPIILSDGQKEAVKQAFAQEVKTYEKSHSWDIFNTGREYEGAKMSEHLISDIRTRFDALIGKGGEINDLDIANLFPVGYTEVITVSKDGESVEVPAMTKGKSSEIEGWGSQKIRAVDFMKWRDAILKAATKEIVSDDTTDLGSE